jgi:hypothetical protein
MFQKRYKYGCIIIVYVFIIAFYSCEHGLKPLENNQPQKSGISGTISYINWPSADRLFDLRLVVFKLYPPENIFDELTAGRAFVYPAIGDESLPFFADTTTYMMELDPGYYEYIAIAQQYGSNLFTDWLAAGQYDTLLFDQSPTPITVQSGLLLEDINIQVDFDSLPHQPF